MADCGPEIEKAHSRSSKPQISCHTPLKPNYIDADDRIVPWETLDFRYKAQPNPPKRTCTPSGPKKKQSKSKKETSKSGCHEPKKKHSKHKKDSGKGSHREAKSSVTATAASIEGCTSSSVDATSVCDLDHSSCLISVLPQCCLLRIFCYLPICYLLRAGLTCRAWQQLSLDKSIWKSVAFEDANILSWKRAAKVLQSHGTIALDFYNIANDEMTDWYNRYCILKKLPGLQYLRFGYAHTSLLLKAIPHLPDLRVLDVCWLTEKCSEIMDGVIFDLGKLSRLTHLRELKIRSVSSLLQPAMCFSGGLKSIEKLQHLQKLSLTSLHESRISPFDYDFLGRLPELVELELGDCGNWKSETYDVLSKLTKLRSLRLENGGCWCNKDCSPQCTCNIAESLRKLTELEKLELIMYVMPSDINPALQFLHKLRTLTFWPTVCLRGHVMGPCAIGCEAPLIQTNVDKCKALGNLQYLRHLTWGVPIITFDNPRPDYPYNVTTEKAVKSSLVLELTDMLAKQLPSTVVNILIVPVMMNKDLYDHPYLDSADDDDSSCWATSGSEFWDSYDSDSDLDRGGALDFGIPFGY